MRASLCKHLNTLGSIPISACHPVQSRALGVEAPIRLKLQASRILNLSHSAGNRALLHQHRRASSVAMALKSRDDPADMSEEASLLEAFSEIPTITGAWVHQAAHGQSTLTVSLMCVHVLYLDTDSAK